LESNWRLNAYRYGLVQYFPLGGWQFPERSPIYARVVGQPYLISNVTKQTADRKCLGFLITGDDRVSFFPTEINCAALPARFPYQFTVEPDEPP
jgi:hypothetical protein